MDITVLVQENKRKQCVRYKSNYGLINDQPDAIEKVLLTKMPFF